MKLSNAVEAFLEYIALIKLQSRATVEAYRNDLAQYELFLQKAAIDSTTEELIRFLGQFNNPHTLNRKLSAINAFFSFCIKSEFIDDAPHIQRSKLPKMLPKFLEYDEIITATDQIDISTWIGLRDRAFILFLYASGTRVSEAIESRKSDLEEGWLRIHHAKGDKERMVPIAPQAIEVIEHYLNARPFSKDQLWLNYRGERLSRISAFKITQKYLGVSPHVLRHSFATALILGGADLRVVQEFLGHVSLDTTQIYTHLHRQDLADTLRDYHPLSKESA